MLATLIILGLAYLVIGLLLTIRITTLLLIAGDLNNESPIAIILGSIPMVITWPRLFLTKE